MTSDTPEGRDGIDALRPVSRRRLADEIVDQIRRLIVDDDLERGARLPSERELATRFEASRAVVAQALRTLSLMGLVDIRRGSGTYVRRDPDALVATAVDLMLDSRHGSVESLCELRLWLETLGALYGADDRQERARVLSAAVAEMEAAETIPSSWIAADTNIHALVVGGAGNAYLTTLYEAVHTAVLSVEYERWIRTDDAPSWISDDTRAHLDLHRPIVEAIAAGDEAAIRAAIDAHHTTLLAHLGSARS